MKTFIISTIVLLISALTFPAQTNDNAGKVVSFKVSKGGKLNATLMSGNINILTWNKDEVSVRMENIDRDEAAPYSINQSGNTINIKSSIGINRNNSDIQITVPSEFNIYIKTYQGNVKLLSSLKGNFQASIGGGNISLEDVNGYVNIKTSGGNIATANILGDADISTSGGNITTGNISGKGDIKTMGGNIILKDVGKDAIVKTSGGDISIRNIGGNVDAKTFGGSIDILKVSGNASLKTSGGDIKLNGVSDYIDAETKGGDIQLHNVYGSVNAETLSGDIIVELKSAGNKPSRISTLNGSIKLYVDPNLKATVSAKAIGGGDSESLIKSDFSPITVNKHPNGEDNVYKINGGGVYINLSAINSGIEIKKLKKY